MYTQHRAQIEALIGRRLHRSEAVHHIDHNARNDDLNNLALMSHTDHIRLHAHLRLIRKLGGDCARAFLERKLQPKPAKATDPVFARQLSQWKRWLRS